MENKKDISIRAIYIGDVRFDQCGVFELNVETNYFEMLIDKEVKYEKDFVDEDPDFIMFEIDKDGVNILTKFVKKTDDVVWMDNLKDRKSFWDGKDLNGREVEVPSVEELIDSLDMDKLKDPNWGKGFMNRSPGFKDEE